MQKRMGIRGLLFLALVLLAWPGAAGAQAQKVDAAIPPNSTIVFSGSSSAFGTLTLNDGSVIDFIPTLVNVTITCDHLVVNGKAEINLTRNVPVPDTPAKPGTPGQAGNNPAPQNGSAGSPGQPGLRGADGINLVFKCLTVDDTNGSLWIDTDGGAGGAGGSGGDGAKGSSGPSTCTSNPNGGNGGPGGPGGAGGPGGDTGAIWASAGGQVLHPHPTTGVSPTPPPQEATLTGVIVIAGNPGPGGTGGPGGNGGPAGEDHGKVGPFMCTDTDSSSGAPGAPGPAGAAGPPGGFTTTPPPNPLNIN
jgi:hypothetical protein